ncbi:hypothetical protein GCM10027452_01580 [Micromonospora halotolerans]
MLCGGNVNDCSRFIHVMAAIRVERPGSGRLRVRPDHVIADKGYSSKAIRADLRRRGIGHTIPERADQQAGQPPPTRQPRRPATGDRQAALQALQRRRTCFNRFKQCRSVATRYGKTATSCRATVTIAALPQWL